MEDREQVQMEFLINTSSKILYNCLSTPSGLSEWFADDVNVRNNVFTFFWNGEEQSARMLTKRRDEMIRFRWMDDEEEDLETFFEFKITVDPITGDTALLITDYAEEDEVDETRQLWEKQVNKLKRIIGG